MTNKNGKGGGGKKIYVYYAKNLRGSILNMSSFRGEVRGDRHVKRLHLDNRWILRGGAGGFFP